MRVKRKKWKRRSREGNKGKEEDGGGEFLNGTKHARSSGDRVKVGKKKINKGCETAQSDTMNILCWNI